MRKPANSKICPRCKLISPLIAIECECGYDLRAAWADQRGQMLERPTQSAGSRMLGAFLFSTGAVGLALDLFGLHSGRNDLGSVWFLFLCPIVFLVGLILFFASF